MTSIPYSQHFRCSKELFRDSTLESVFQALLDEYLCRKRNKMSGRFQTSTYQLETSTGIGRHAIAKALKKLSCQLHLIRLEENVCVVNFAYYLSLISLFNGANKENRDKIRKAFYEHNISKLSGLGLKENIDVNAEINNLSNGNVDMGRNRPTMVEIDPTSNVESSKIGTNVPTEKNRFLKVGTNVPMELSNIWNILTQYGTNLPAVAEIYHKLGRNLPYDTEKLLVELEAMVAQGGDLSTEETSNKVLDCFVRLGLNYWYEMMIGAFVHYGSDVPYTMVEMYLGMGTNVPIDRVQMHPCPEVGTNVPRGRYKCTYRPGTNVPTVNIIKEKEKNNGCEASYKGEKDKNPEIKNPDSQVEPEKEGKAGEGLKVEEGLKVGRSLRETFSLLHDFKEPYSYMDEEPSENIKNLEEGGAVAEDEELPAKSDKYYEDLSRARMESYKRYQEEQRSKKPQSPYKNKPYLSEAVVSKYIRGIGDEVHSPAHLFIYMLWQALTEYVANDITPELDDNGEEQEAIPSVQLVSSYSITVDKYSRLLGNVYEDFIGVVEKGVFEDADGSRHKIVFKDFDVEGFRPDYAIEWEKTRHFDEPAYRISMKGIRNFQAPDMNGANDFRYSPKEETKINNRGQVRLVKVLYETNDKDLSPMERFAKKVYQTFFRFDETWHVMGVFTERGCEMHDQVLADHQFMPAFLRFANEEGVDCQDIGAVLGNVINVNGKPVYTTLEGRKAAFSVWKLAKYNREHGYGDSVSERILRQVEEELGLNNI